MDQTLSAYDYVIVGGGLSGLLTAYRMSQHPAFKESTILILEPQSKTGNDRTWCYWESGQGEWDELLTRQWTQARVQHHEEVCRVDLSDYTYKMLRSEVFYGFIHDRLTHCPNIHRQVAKVQHLHETANGVLVEWGAGKTTAGHVLTSVMGLHQAPVKTSDRLLHQHFGGWFIQTKDDAFDPEVAVLMDFSVPQQDGVCFMYLLPTSKRDALAEFTVFGPRPWTAEQYDQLIREYLSHRVKDYTIVEKELGSIPMTVYPFERNNTARITHIGSAGGWTRPSTGYTFKLSTDYSKKLVDQLAHSQKPTAYLPARHRLYDAVMLELIGQNHALGADFFMRMYRLHPIARVFRFLDGRSSLREELLIMWTSRPRMRLVKLAMRRLLGM